MRRCLFLPIQLVGDVPIAKNLKNLPMQSLVAGPLIPGRRPSKIGHVFSLLWDLNWGYYSLNSPLEFLVEYWNVVDLCVVGIR